MYIIEKIIETKAVRASTHKKHRNYGELYHYITTQDHFKGYMLRVSHIISHIQSKQKAFSQLHYSSSIRLEIRLLIGASTLV